MTKGVEEKGTARELRYAWLHSSFGVSLVGWMVEPPDRQVRQLVEAIVRAEAEPSQAAQLRMAIV